MPGNVVGFESPRLVAGPMRCDNVIVPDRRVMLETLSCAVEQCLVCPATPSLENCVVVEKQSLVSDMQKSIGRANSTRGYI